MLYPVFKCTDGHVRICVLNPRQWRSISEWLGKDHPFTDPKFEINVNRFVNIGAINSIIATFFETQTREYLVAQGQLRGIPIASINLPIEVFDNAHYKQRNLFSDIEVSGKMGKAPAGYICIDGHRMGIRSPSPVLGANTPLCQDSCRL